MSVAHDHGGHGPYTVEDLHAREDEGRGLELEDGWLIEVSASSPHNWVSMHLWELLKAAAANAEVFVALGGEWEISTPAGIRKPDLFVVPKSMARASIVNRDPVIIPGSELLLVVEVISPGSGSERTDRVKKLSDYAAIGIPQYWIVEFTPLPKVQVFVLDQDGTSYWPGGVGTYRLDRTVEAGETLDAKIEAEKPFTVRFDPQTLTEF
ncbi:Uma2 family endonuclease [Actinomadura spongiicola]|uniref:Uma2 family endonuclease n=1 Tax=Actinomadura spongiicola TaxID=2303421 RepID=A0A372GBP3_9ACTN|nr:Uma2 family endonuclease [Actinomadura spongiicola]RFS82814.1 Uma2 family endonuclease [Actinomadura spongiicola]